MIIRITLCLCLYISAVIFVKDVFNVFFFSFNFTTAGRVGIVKIKIKPQKNLIEEKLTYIFHEFVTCFDEMVFLQRPWPYRYFNYCSHMSPIQIGINISTGALPREMYPELSKLIQDTREKLRHFISPDNKDAVKSARIIVEKLLNFLNDIKTKYNAKRLEITWEEAMVISVEFDNEYDLRTFLRCSYFLRRDTRDTFALIFRHVNEIRLATPYVEIQHAVLDSKLQSYTFHVLIYKCNYDKGLCAVW